MSHLFVNCRKINFTATLGVAHAILRLATALTDHHEITFVVKDLEGMDRSPSGKLIRSIATDVTELHSDDDVATELRRSSIEILPHHFQAPEICDRSVMMCHDLHVFDIPWKYGKRAVGMQRLFRRCLTSATVVMAHFPRTYYSLERTANIQLPNLFLTESPLLQDVCSAGIEPNTHTGTATFLYPAQLQEHKNHEALVRGVAELRRRGIDVAVVCPGSDFDDAITNRVHGLIEAEALTDSFEFPGRVSDERLLELYRRSDAVIVPSLAEGGAYVPLEAIASGKPVAVNSIESARMHLGSMEGHALWFDGRDISSTADALQRLAEDDPQEWFDRNARCRERIAATTWELVAERWNAVIEMLDGERPRPIVLTDRCTSEIVYA